MKMLPIQCVYKIGDGMCAAIKIEKLFNKRCKEYKQKYKMNVGVYLTPQALSSQWAA